MSILKGRWGLKERSKELVFLGEAQGVRRVRKRSILQEMQQVGGRGQTTEGFLVHHCVE